MKMSLCWGPSGILQECLLMVARKVASEKRIPELGNGAGPEGWCLWPWEKQVNCS